MLDVCALKVDFISVEYMAFKHKPVHVQKISFSDFSTLRIKRYPSHVFRGVGSSTYKLIPKLYRSDDTYDGLKEARNLVDSYLKYNGVFEIGFQGMDDSTNIDIIEMTLLEIFTEQCNDQSLPVVNTHVDLVNPLYRAINCITNDSTNVPSKSSIEQMLEMGSLAQHYGLPTRLLDWTRDLDVALYFSVLDVINNNHLIDDGYISIWVLNYEFLRQIIPEVVLIKPYYNSNPNLAAQSGLHSTVLSNELSIRKQPLDELVSNRCEKDIEKYEHYSSIFHHDSILRRYDISYKELNDVIEYLLSHNLNANRFFPGYRGSAESLFEYKKMDEYLKKNF